MSATDLRSHHVRRSKIVTLVPRCLPALVVAAAVIVTLCACPTNPAGSVWFVAPDGTDGGPGSIRRPWATLSFAVSRAIAGDTVLVREGTYRERLVLENSGTAEAPIVFAAFPGETPVIDGEDVEQPDGWGGMVEINGVEHVELRGFHIRNSSVCAIQANDSAFITISNNYTYNSVWPGVMVWGTTDVVVSGNEVVEACTGGENHQECISLSHAERFEVVGNHVHHGYMEGIDVKVGCKNGSVHGNEVHDLVRLGIYLDAYTDLSSDIDIYDNVVYRCREGIRVSSEQGGSVTNIRVYDNVVYENDEVGFWTTATQGIDGSPHTISNVSFSQNVSRHNGLEGFRIYTPDYLRLEEVTLTNNVIYGNGGAGISITDYTGGTAELGPVRIINNTIADNGRNGGWGSGGIHINAPNAELILVRNNIIADNEVFSIGVDEETPAAAVTIDHNLIFGYRDSVEFGETIGDSPVTGDPLFVGAPHGDFRLQSGSPAIDAGAETDAPANDFDGATRPAGAAVDIGAFEAG